MPDVSKIRLPDSTEVNIKDARIKGVDTTPTAGSMNVVTSGGVKDAIPDVTSITNSEIDTIMAS